MQADLASWIQWGCWQWDQWTYQSHREDSKFHRTGLHMKGKCLNQGGLSSWLQISSAANIEFIKFQVRFFFEAAIIRSYLLQSGYNGFEDINLSIGAAMAVCSKFLLVVVEFFSFLCVVLCVYHIYGAGAYRVHLIMGSFYLVCFKIIRRMQQSFKTSAA